MVMHQAKVIFHDFPEVNFRDFLLAGTNVD